MKRIIPFLLFYFVLFFPYNKLCYADNKQKSADVIYDKVYDLLGNKSFSQADAILQQILISKELSVDGLRIIEELYRKFSPLHDEELLNAWCNASQNSHFPYAIRGGYYLEKASEARGTRYARHVTEKQWEDMGKFLALAQADFEKSYALEPRDPYSASKMIRVCLLKGYPREVMENWFNRAIQADNYWLAPYYAKMAYLAPQWYGKANESKEFWKKCFYDSPKGSAVYSMVFDTLKSRVNTNKFIVKAHSVGSGAINQETLGMIQEGVKRLKVDFPKSSFPVYYEALLSIYENNYEQALSAIDDIVKRYPRNETYIQAKIALLFMLNKDNEAAKELNNLFEINKNSKFALANIGSLKINKYNDIEGGISDFIKIINQEDTDPNKGYYYYVIGSILDLKGKYDIAIDYFTKSLDIVPEYTLSRYRRAYAKHKIGDLDGAIEDMLIVKEDEKYKKEATNLLERYMNEKSNENLQKDQAGKNLTEVKKKPSDPTVDFQDERKKEVKRPLVEENTSYQLSDCEGFYYRKMKQKAHECVSSLLARNPENGALYYLAGQIAENLEYDFDAASSYYGAAVSKSPENEKYILSFGRSIYMQRQYDLAITIFSKLIEVNSSHGEAYYYRGLCFESVDNREKAIEDMQLAALYGPKIDEARAFVEQYGKREPQKPSIGKIEQLEILAADNSRLGRIAEAEKQYQEIVKLDPHHDRAWYQLGEIYMERDDREQALRCYTQAIESNKENDQYLIRRGFLFKKMNKFDLAMKDYSHAILISPRGYSYLERARCYKELKEYKKSEQDLFSSLKNRDGSENGAFMELGVVLPKTGTKIQFTPDNKQILIYRAGEYYNQGKFDLAKDDYQAFLKIDPENDEIYHRLGMMLFERMKNIDGAILNLSKAIEKNSRKNVYYLERGRMYFAKNDFLKAKDDFSKEIELAPTNGWGFMGRGDCYNKLGQKDLALKDYKKAKELDSSLFRTVQPEDMLR